jgi:hypothetical protein
MWLLESSTVKPLTRLKRKKFTAEKTAEKIYAAKQRPLLVLPCGSLSNAFISVFSSAVKMLLIEECNSIIAQLKTTSNYLKRG